MDYVWLAIDYGQGAIGLILLLCAGAYGAGRLMRGAVRRKNEQQHKDPT